MLFKTLKFIVPTQKFFVKEQDLMNAVKTAMVKDNV